jgi:hypothetical protein
MPDQTLHQTYDLIVRDFDLEPQTAASIKEVKQFLAKRITILMHQNMGLLMSILYRIDVQEARLKMILEYSPAAEMPGQLADLVIERQLQKVKTRKQYRE